jgi:hypothetical protein
MTTQKEYAFCNVYDTEFMQNCLVEILEYTHHKSAVPRAKVLYSSKEFSKEFYIPRSKLIKPIVLKSHVLHHWDGYNIEVIAYFYKHPDQEFCDNTTHYKIQTINISGFAFDTLKHLSEFINKPVSLVKAEIEKQLLYYVDELPF